MILNKLIIIFIENKKGGEYLPPNLNAFILLRKTTNEISFFKEIFNNLRTKATFRISLSDK